MALSPSAAARLRTWISSSCCSHVERPGRDGQSMLATDATHTPRNSRRTCGTGADARRCASSGAVKKIAADKILVAFDLITDETLDGEHRYGQDPGSSAPRAKSITTEAQRHRGNQLQELFTKAFAVCSSLCLCASVVNALGSLRIATHAARSDRL